MPSLLPNNAGQEDFFTTNLDMGPKPSTGFEENWSAALGLAIDEEMSISSDINGPDFKARNEHLYKLINEGNLKNSDAFIKSDSPNHVQYDWNALAREAKKQGIDTQTDTELLGETRQKLAERRSYAMGIMEKANISGDVGILAGYMQAGVLDPVNVGAALLGPIAMAKYLGNIASIRRVMIAEGALGAASEAAISPFVHDWKQTLGVDYTLDQALLNMGAAGLMNAGIGGLAAKLGQIMSSAEKTGIDVTPLRLNKEELDRAAAELGPNMDAEEYMRKSQAAAEELNKPVDKGPVLDPTAEKPKVKVDAQTSEVQPELPATEMYVTTEDGLIKTDLRTASKALDNQIKDVDAEMGVPICGG